jgi:hypothetical protein
MKDHELKKWRETASEGRLEREKEKEGERGGGRDVIDMENGRGRVEGVGEERRAGGKVRGSGGREVGEVEGGAVPGGDRWVHPRHRGGKMVM